MTNPTAAERAEKALLDAPGYSYHKSLSVITQAIADAEAAARAWRPIESAPKDGTAILVGRVGWSERTTVRSWGGIWTTYNGYGLSWEPTHWMPLHAPPEARTPAPATEGES